MRRSVLQLGPFLSISKKEARKLLAVVCGWSGAVGGAPAGVVVICKYLFAKRPQEAHTRTTVLAGSWFTDNTMRFAYVGTINSVGFS